MVVPHFPRKGIIIIIQSARAHTLCRGYELLFAQA